MPKGPFYICYVNIWFFFFGKNLVNAFFLLMNVDVNTLKPTKTIIKKSKENIR